MSAEDKSTSGGHEGAGSPPPAPARTPAIAGVVRIGSFNMLGLEMPFRGVQFYDFDAASLRQRILKSMDAKCPPCAYANIDWCTNASAYERPTMVPRFSICCNLTRDKLDSMATIAEIVNEQERAAAFGVAWQEKTDPLPSGNMEEGKLYDRCSAMHFDRVTFEILREVIAQNPTDDFVPFLFNEFDDWNIMSISERFKLAYWTLWGLDSTGRGVATSDDEDTNENEIAQMKLAYILDTMQKRKIDVMLIQENGLSGIPQITGSGYALHFSTNGDFAYIAREGWEVEIPRDSHKNFEHVRITSGDARNIVIDAVNVHLPSKPSKCAATLPLLQQLMRELSVNFRNVMLAGDFNCDLAKVTHGNDNGGGKGTNDGANNKGLKMGYSRPDGDSQDDEEKFAEDPFTCNKTRTAYQPQQGKAGVNDRSVKDYVLKTISEATDAGPLTTLTYVETLSEMSDHSLVHRKIEIIE